MKKPYLPAAALACLLWFPAAVRSQQSPEEALELARSGRVEEALEAIDAALATHPASSRALFARGVILAENGRRDEAAGAFRQLIEWHPDQPEAYNNLAVIQAAEGDFDRAVSTLKSALATDASYQTAYENLTRIFAQLASEAYSRALEVDSPPARHEVELQLLAELPSAPGPVVADRAAPPARAVPAEPVAEPAGAVPAEPMAEPAAPGLESEDLALAELEDEAPASAEPPSTDDLADVVERWARAWSDQRVEDYLAFYAADFAPDNGMSRGDWERYRRDRIGSPEFIKVEVAILDSLTEGEDLARITFLQAYESDTYRDQVTKTLTLVRRDEGWKILEEKSGS